jgi:hypothetical protein
VRSYNNFELFALLLAVVIVYYKFLVPKDHIQGLDEHVQCAGDFAVLNS